MIPTLFICLLFAHWLGDYTHLSRPYMLAAKRTGAPLMPIFDHALVHACLVAVVVTMYLPNNPLSIGPLVICFMLELVTHFLIDVLKGRLNVWMPKLKNPANPYHWYVFGLDQCAHLLVLLWIANIITYFS